MEQFYALGFLLSMVFLVILVIVGQKQNITNFLLLFVAITISNLGYYTISIAPSLIVAIRGNNLVYLGSVFAPMLLFLSVAKLCQKKIKKRLILFLVWCAGVILFFSFQIENQRLFYRNLTLVERNGVSILEKEYGPMHALYPIYIFLCMGLAMWVLWSSLFNKERVSWKVTATLLTAGIISASCYVGKRIMHSDIEWMVSTYLLDELLILLLIRRIGMYEVSDSIANSLKEHSTYGYLIFDKRRKYLGCNDMAKEYLPEIKNLLIDYRIRRKNTFLYENVAEKLLQYDEDKPEEYYYISRNEQEIRCLVKPLYHGMRKRKVGYMLEMVDDTQRQKYIRLLNEHNEALEVEKKKADDANRAKSEFLSNMSHDIRTPMNAIVGFASLMERNADNPDKVREYTRKITFSSQHLLNLINDILDMSKIESGKTTLNMEEFSLTELLEVLYDMMLPQAKAKTQEFELHTEGELPEFVRGDKLRLNQVLLNLLSNAVKYTQEGGNIELAVKLLEQVGEDHARLLFMVKDNGFGMSEEFVKTIFEPFSRETTASTKEIQGTGLGMAITKSIVDLMSGNISLQSKLGEGSEFLVELELETLNRSEQDGELRKKQNISQDIDLSGIKVLAAEDNEINQEILVELMKAEGVECDIASDGKEALDKFLASAPGQYDMIFMDVHMPVMDGYAAAQAIRASAHEEAGTIPIIAMTADAFEEDVKKALDAGMNAHTAKPIDMDKLKATMAGLR